MCPRGGREKQVRGTYLQIALGHARKPALFSSVGRPVWRECAASLIISLILFLFIAKLPADASEVPGASRIAGPIDATGAQLLGIQVSSKNGQEQVTIELSADVQYVLGHLSSPERLYLDFPQTVVNPRLSDRRIRVQDGLIDQIRIGIGQGPATRVVLDLAMPVRYRVSKVESPTRMLIELSRPAEGAALARSIPMTIEAARRSPENTDSQPLGALPAGRAAPSILQSGDLRSDSSPGPQTYGNGEKAGLAYAGTASPRNVLFLGLDFGTSYDDNVFGNNQQRVGGEEFSIGPSVNLRREGNRFGLGLTYRPNFRIYRSAAGLNTLDQAAGLDASYLVTPRLSFRARTDATYSNGLFRPSQNEAFLTGLGSPSGLNQTVYTPTLHQLSLSSRVDLGYQLGPHDSVDLYGGESLLNFDQQIPNLGSLSNTRETDAGIVYQHRLSPHATLGMDYLFEDIRYGPNSETQVHSGFFSYAQQFSPSVTISIFGGPQYSFSNELLSFALGPFLIRVPISSADLHWALGGTLIKRLDRTVVEISAQHQVSNGGGLIGAVVATSGGASVRRRLPGHWDAVWSGSYAKNRSLVAGGPTGDYQGETAGFGLERPLTDKLSLRFGYDFLRQRGNGQSQYYADVDRDLFSIQFSYKFHQIALNQ